MPRTKNILIGTCGIGAATLFCLIIAIAHIINEIQMIENELDVEIEAFQLKANDLWRDMISMNITPHRQRRQYPFPGNLGIIDQSSKGRPELTAGINRYTVPTDSYGRGAQNTVIVV
ncbi:unnamed protein product [Wuchereria bancrofti]|uniref:Nematode cuticle collagen N-terminal domain-containing protein n=1 Tax=Wuchereria bancrofti TaxID=6293 RepID=A0A3P7FVH5_WUCBA|nr:unnamed protein product [Wuchereria bancrofti]